VNVRCFALLILLFVPNAAQTVSQIVHAVESRYSNAKTLQAKFYERYRASGQPSQSESGTVYFSKPGRMRWEYESPSTKLFLVDGVNVWLYVPADRTASRAKLKESDDWRTPLALLTGKVHLDHLCGKIELIASTDINSTSAADAPLDPRNLVLNCSPRKSAAGDDTSSSFRQILFEVDPEYHLTRVVVREPSDIETEFRFGDWRENVSVPESMFHFDPPPGVSIVNAEDLARAIH
jgi:outer membrane lipoprotein carrier protein